MDPHAPHSPRPPKAHAKFGRLILSAAAVAALLYFESHPLSTEVARARGPEGAPAAAAPSAGPAAAVTAERATDGATPDDATPDTEASPGVIVPEVTGLRLSTARKRLRAVGLDVAPRDRWDDRIYPRTHRFYRVRRQATPAGTTAEPGQRVAVEAHRIGLASGY